MIEVAGDVAGTAHRVLLMREDSCSRITEHLGRASGNGHRVLERLFDQPVISVANARDWLGITQAGANNLVRRLEQLGLLREFTGYARHRRFRFEPYLRLFEDREGKVGVTASRQWKKRGSTPGWEHFAYQPGGFEANFEEFGYGG